MGTLAKNMRIKSFNPHFFPFFITLFIKTYFVQRGGDLRYLMKDMKKRLALRLD